MKQHSDTISNFLCQELNLYNPNDVSKQIYFVSAKKENNSFNEFVKHFCNEISKNAIEIKFKPHFDKVRKILTDINEFILSYFDIVNKENHMDDQRIKDFRNSILNLVAENFLKISNETKLLVEGNVPKIVFNLQNAVEKKVELDQLSINFLEVEFAKIISDCFRSNLTDLENIITKKFMENSTSKTTIEKIESYFTNTNDLKDLSNEYEKCIVLNFKNVSTNIRNSFNVKENRVTIFNTILKSLNIGSKALVIPAFLLKKAFAPVAIAFTALSIAGEFIPKSTNDDIPKEILNAFSQYYLGLTECLIGYFQDEVNLRIEQSIIDFVIHQKQIYITFEEFDNIQQQCVTILNDVFETDDNLMI